jgi:diadenosine tetraphosphate (Ap4A) HIT family hydrolase
MRVKGQDPVIQASRHGEDVGLESSISRSIGWRLSERLLRRFAFLDIGPLSKGHALVIPKCALCRRPVCLSLQVLADRVVHLPDHAAKLHELPDSEMSELLPAAKKIAAALGCEDYNVLQNNGRAAHQVRLQVSICLYSHGVDPLGC